MDPDELGGERLDGGRRWGERPGQHRQPERDPELRWVCGVCGGPRVLAKVELGEAEHLDGD